MQPLYYLPKRKPADLLDEHRPSRQKISEAGLGHLVLDMDDDAAALACVVGEVVQGGPDGGHGTVLAVRSTSGGLPSRFGVHLDAQTWYRPEAGDVWVGLVNGQPVTPDDIKRTTFIEGWRPLLGDGNRWTIPTLRRPSGGTDLPCGYRKRGNGTIDSIVAPAYVALWESSAEVMEHFLATRDGQAGSLTPDDRASRRLDLCLGCLGFNYRYSLLEQNVLMLVGTTTWRPILMAAVDFPAWPDEKKTSVAAEAGTLPASPSSNAGSPDSSTTPTPPATN